MIANSNYTTYILTRRKIRNEELNRLSVSDYKSAGKVPIVVVLDSVRSLNNVGSAFRTCDAFLVEKIFFRHSFPKSLVTCNKREKIARNVFLRLH